MSARLMKHQQALNHRQKDRLGKGEKTDEWLMACSSSKKARYEGSSIYVSLTGQ
jgi:hypothetical protein